MQKKRHVFLLEQVLIVTKEKSDMGMTHAFSTRDSMKLKSVGLNPDVVSSGVGDNSLKFEIWVGKSENPCQKYEFQVSAAEMFVITQEVFMYFFSRLVHPRSRSSGLKRLRICYRTNWIQSKATTPINIGTA